MKTSSFLKPVFLLAGASLLATGCVYRQTVYRNPPPPPGAVVEAPPGPPGSEVVVAGEPPPPIVEDVTIAPAPGFVWIRGAYIWQGRWVWFPGHWDRPPRRGVVWVEPRYVFRGGRHIWVRGYWR